MDETSTPRAGRPTVSAIVRAHNEAKHLPRLLEGLRRQTIRPDEIVVVDSGSTDDTVAIAEASGCRVVHIRKEDFSFGRSLNYGCEAATGEILLIVSAHVYPVYDTYVEHMVGAFDREGVGIAYGRQIGDERTKFSESRIMLQWFPSSNIWDQGHPFSNNANSAILKREWAATKYDETLTGLEDLDFAQKAIARSVKVAYVADAPVVHVHEETWATIRNRYRREAIAYARIIEGSKLSFIRAMSLMIANIAGDYRDASRASVLRSNLWSIPRFRHAQFTGAWEGFRVRGRVDAELLQRFYYPPSDGLGGEATAPGRPIDYSGFTKGA